MDKRQTKIRTYGEQAYSRAATEPKRNVFVLAKLKFHMVVVILMMPV